MVSVRVPHLKEHGFGCRFGVSGNSEVLVGCSLWCVGVGFQLFRSWVVVVRCLPAFVAAAEVCQLSRAVTVFVIPDVLVWLCGVIRWFWHRSLRVRFVGWVLAPSFVSRSWWRLIQNGGPFWSPVIFNYLKGGAVSQAKPTGYRPFRRASRGGVSFNRVLAGLIGIVASVRPIPKYGPSIAKLTRASMATMAYGVFKVFVFRV